MKINDNDDDDNIDNDNDEDNDNYIDMITLHRFDYVCEGFLCSIGSGDFHIEQECDRALQARHHHRQLSS